LLFWGAVAFFFAKKNFFYFFAKYVSPNNRRETTCIWQPRYLSPVCTLPVPMLLAHSCTQFHWLSQPEPQVSGWIRHETNVFVFDSWDTSRQVSPSPFLWYSLTHAYRSIGYRNHNPKPLVESTVRLMYLRVYYSRDSSNSRQPSPSPSLVYSFTHTHRSIGYRNRNPQPLAESTTRLMYLRVYDSRDSSCQSAPSPSPCYPLTHTYRSIGYRNRNPLWLNPPWD
jgi:hypothetical protein